MRAHAPLLRAGSRDAPLYFVSRHRDVSLGLKDSESFSSAMGQADPLPGFILNMDPPEHTRLRALVAAAFTPRAMRAAEEAVRVVVERRWAAVLARGGGDLVTEFATPCTVEVISTILGDPDAEPRQVREWTRQSNAYLGRILRAAPNEGVDDSGYRALQAYLDAALDRAQRREDADTVVANLARLRDRGALTREEAAGFAGLLLMAGHETTTILTGNCFDLLLELPAELDRLREPGGAKMFLEEVLRFRPTVHRITRRAAVDTEIGGYCVPVGAAIRFLAASANRDEDVFPDGERFDPGRAPGSLATFGYGPHLCIGAWLARMEVRMMLETVGRTTSALRFNPKIGRQPLAGGAFATSGLVRLGAEVIPRS